MDLTLIVEGIVAGTCIVNYSRSPTFATLVCQFQLSEKVSETELGTDPGEDTAEAMPAREQSDRRSPQHQKEDWTFEYKHH
jgi:hypothetical protein